METSLESTAIAEPQPSRAQVSPFGFVQRRLPWIIAGALFVLYLITLSRWVSHSGMTTLARAAGWDWRVVYHGPLHFLVTFPVRWLPADWQVIGLNLFAAMCAFLTLALLARSVAILPFDRTRDERQLEHNEFSFLSIPTAWLPPVFAVLVCGLQLTFWEHSTIATGELLDLLLFAYCVRCLLEFRLDERDSWLYRMAFVLGLGMTSNFAMIGFLPAFVISVLWIKGLNFFKWKFLLKAALCGLAGLLLYLLPAAIYAGSPLTEDSFWEILRIELGGQKSRLLSFPRYIIAVVALTSVLPVFFIGIKWPDQLGDVSAIGNALTRVMTHIIHAVFLVAAVYVVFDPPYSPRKLGMGQPMLPFYYLGALSVGYMSGYFLLVFSQMTFKPWVRYQQLLRIRNWAIIAIVWLAAIGVPVGLIVKNWPEIRKTSSPYLARLAAQSIESLPDKGGVILSDDPFRLYAVYDALNRKGLLNRWAIVDTSQAGLPNSAYHRYLRKKYGERWPDDLTRYPVDRPLGANLLIDLVFKISDSQEVYYLQPSFGYYFEYFYLSPRNLIYEVKPYPRGTLIAPLPTAQEFGANDLFWKNFIARQLPALRQPGTDFKSKKPPERNPSIYAVAEMYARSLTWLGVEAQKAGMLDKARDYFEAALQLNPDSASAFINREYNTLLRAGKKENPEPSEGALQRLALHRGDWYDTMNDDGPLDQPGACYVIAQEFTRGSLFRQAVQHFARVAELNPENRDVSLSMATTLIQGRFPIRALELAAQIRSEATTTPLTPAQDVALTQTEAWAHVMKGDIPQAEKLLNDVQEKYPKDDAPFSTLIEIYFRTGQSSNAVKMLERELNRDAASVGALVNYAALKIGSKEYEAAIAMLDRAIKVDPENAYARINRAIACLQIGRLDQAKADYDVIVKNQAKPPHAVHFGLGEIAWRKKQRKTALKHYEEYLKTAPVDTAEYQSIKQRVASLKAGKV